MDEKQQAATLSNDKTEKGILKKTDTSNDAHKKSVRFSEEIGIQLVPARRQSYIKEIFDGVIGLGAILFCINNSRTNQKDNENELALIAGGETGLREFADRNPRMKDFQDQSEDIGPFKFSSEINPISENETIGTATEKQKLPLPHHQSTQSCSKISFDVPEKKNLKGTIKKAINEAPTSFDRRAKEVERAKMEK